MAGQRHVDGEAEEEGRGENERRAEEDADCAGQAQLPADGIAQDRLHDHAEEEPDAPILEDRR